MKSIPSWPPVEIPVIPGSPVPVSLYDSASQSIRVVRGVDGNAGTVRLYVCGITPYDATHLGHAATYLAFDTLLRALTQAGHEVEYAQNITDVDDPLFERAAKVARPWQDIALEQTDLFRSDMRALRVQPPAEYVRVQDVVGDIADAVGRLIDAGFGYRVATEDADGEDIYFDLAAAQARTDFHVAGVSHFSPERLAAAFVEFGGDPEREGKRNPMDPLLWRAARDGEPSWQAPFGAGRPGWHVECAVIATGTLGQTITIQGGGRDLRFPHHEMSAAHASALTGRTFADFYAHAGLIAYDGEKMSKSLGNLVLVSNLTAAGHDPAAIRLALLAHHYREDWEWRDADLAAAEARLALWRAAASRALAAADAGAGTDAGAGADAGTDADAGTVAETEATTEDRRGDRIQRVREHLASDLDTPSALREVDAWAAEPVPAADIIPVIDALLGIRLA